MIQSHIMRPTSLDDLADQWGLEGFSRSRQARSPASMSQNTQNERPDPTYVKDLTPLMYVAPCHFKLRKFVVVARLLFYLGGIKSSVCSAIATGPSSSSMVACPRPMPVACQ